MRGLVFKFCLGLTANLAAAAPFSFPLPNGFPFPNETALEELFTRAGGNFTNAPLAPKFDDDSLTSWKLQAFNEFFEVAFFTQLIANITNDVPGYVLHSSERTYVLDALQTIQAQEQMHAYNANDAVRYFTPDGAHVFPCTYVFPVTDYYSAIAFAQTFTDMYIGLLTNIQQRTTKNLGSDANSVIYVLAQALGQEGQQSGFYRALQGKLPSAEPFLTSSTREFAFSWLQRFVVPGSCPNLEIIPLKTIPPLDLLQVKSTDHETATVTLRHQGQTLDQATHRVAFVNGALVPTLIPFDVIDEAGGAVTISAELPFAHNVMHGLTVAAIVKNGGDFITAEDVTNATVFGPAVIEIA